MPRSAGQDTKLVHCVGVQAVENARMLAAVLKELGPPVRVIDPTTPPAGPSLFGDVGHDPA